MARPRGAECLEDEMTALSDTGVEVLVCALTQAELELTAQARTATAAGLRFVAIPIPDRSVPDTGEQKACTLELLEHVSSRWNGLRHAGFSPAR